ncbi:MAG: DMT family transporter [Proteobacteria bacterium]|nr:DMT family transporter [Pseudomonadota bacterium]
MKGRLKGTFYVLLCVASWALIPVVAKTGQTTLDNHQFLFWSSVVSFLVLVVLLTFSGRSGEVRHYTLKDWTYLGFLGLLGTYLYYLFLYLGYSQADGMEVLVIQYTWPVFIVLFSIPILNERLSYRKVISIMLGFTGVIIVFSKGEFQSINVSNPSVILLVGVGAVCFALFSVLSKNVNKEPLGVVSIYFLSASIASFVSMLFFSEFATPSITELWPVLINGIIVNGFSYLFWLIALRSTDASYLAPFIFITPVLSAVYLIIFFNEPIVPAYVVSLICVVVGGLVNRS